VRALLLKVYNINKKRSHKTFATLFGSDLFRTNPADRPEQRKIFEIANYTVMGINMDNAFLEYFPGLKDKIRHAQYGSFRLELIDQLHNTLTQENIKTELGISKNKTVITLGYNGKPEQQHNLFLEILYKLPIEIKNTLVLIVPLTYGRENEKYLSELKDSIANIGIEFLLLEKKINRHRACKNQNSF
jgi:hypothetical protein